MYPRRFSFVDRCFVALDTALATLDTRPRDAARPYPAGDNGAEALAESDRRHAAALMRVNHAGEIAAQGLYQGQALGARDSATRDQLYRAGNEENDHLAWCERRLDELDSRPSRLAPLWYFGSVGIGALAALAGDRWSLGFIAETERQVVDHLESHFSALPQGDGSSRAIVHQMREDEARHAREALAAGGEALPRPVRGLMRGAARIMTTTAYYL